MAMQSDAPPTPMLDKMRVVVDVSQKIGDFLDWLGDQGILLCRVPDRGKTDNWYPIPQGFSALLHSYFGIDADIEERERRLVLDYVRSQREASHES